MVQLDSNLKGNKTMSFLASYFADTAFTIEEMPEQLKKMVAEEDKEKFEAWLSEEN